ncbi:MAG: protein kinase [Anaerolineae bacterium]|nr:protein kinase [Anaerolineae bacterium]
MPLIENTILENRYRIEGLLSQGGMGAIYRAFDTNLKTPVAIKENFFQTAHSIQQFQQEALILARLRHPSLPRVIHHFSFNRKQYLVMDFIAGEDLWEIIQKQGQPLDERQALTYMVQVCKAVSYLHRQAPPIIHRDIKPQNIKITPDNQAVLVDFGIAKVVETDSRTHTGAQAFTPGFSPPEQYSGAGTTLRSDIYALGATLYAILLGKKPPDSISRMVGNSNYHPPHLLNPSLSRAVSGAIEHAMQIQAARRPASVEVWRKELEAILADATVFPSPATEEVLEEPTLRSTVSLKSAMPGGETQAMPPFSADPQPPETYSRLWFGFGGILLLSLLGFLLFSTMRSDSMPKIVAAQTIATTTLTATNPSIIMEAEIPTRIDAEATVGAVLTAAALQEESEAATRQAQATLTATNTPLPPSATPSATSPPPTATSTLTPAPVFPSITVETNANLRSGPGTLYERVGELAAGATVEIVGRTEDSRWWQISYPTAPQGVAWLAADLGTATAVDAVAVAAIPPTPTIAPSTPTPESTIKILKSTEMETFRNNKCPISGETLIDSSNDVSSAYTDILQVSSSLSGETLSVTFILRDIPQQLTFNRPGIGQGNVEYQWAAYIDVDANPETGQIGTGWEYGLDAKTIIASTNAPSYELPIETGVEPSVWQCEESGFCMQAYDATMTVERESRKLTLTGNVPGITPASRLVFMTSDYFAGYDIAACP